MEIEYERTLEDLIEFNLFHISHSPTLRRETLYTRVFLAFLTTLLVTSLGYLLFQDGIILSIPFSIIGGIVTFAFYPDLARRSMIDKLRKLLSEGDNKAASGHHKITLSPDGIYCKTQSGESRLNWSSLTKLTQNQSYVFLYTGATNALVIPTKAFASEKQLQEFLDYVNSHLEQKTEGI